MAILKDPNKKHYFAEVDPGDYKEIFEKAVSDETEILIWEQGMSEKEAEKYFIQSYDSSSYTVHLKTAGGLLSKLSTSKLSNKDVFVRVGTGKFQFFTTCKFIHNKEEKSYQFVVNRTVFKTMQRQNYRLQAGPNIKIQIRIDEDTLLNGLDISAGGTAFIVGPEEAPRYQKDTLFKDCKLALNKEKFSLPTVRVAGSWPIKDTENNPTGEMKVGVSFEDIPDDTEEAMFKAINGEARAEEMRKKMLEKKLNKGS
ncbi:MAG: hypothetical protein NXH75_18240 [Halobacteriovoraceae bacterium]|nr:hypothetical protein [Halobacteriovoraceae bacterium]